MLLSAVLVAGMTVQTWGQRWSGDYWLHRAAVIELSLHPWSPDHPLTPSSAADPNLSPYTLVLGLAARVTGADAGDVLSVAALFNVVLLIVGLRLFVRRFSPAPLAPFWTLLATLFLWGIGPWRWSGYLNANSIGFGLPYPSMFAFAVMLFGLSALDEVMDRARLRDLTVVAASATLVVLSHPFTGGTMVLAGAAMVAGRASHASRRAILRLGVAAVLAAVVALAWPHYPILGLPGEASAYDGLHERLYRLVATRTFLVLPGLVVLAARLRTNHRDPLGLILLSAGGVFVAGWLSDRHSLGRILPLAMLAAHVGLGVWLAEKGPSIWRGLKTVGRAMAIASGAVLLLLGIGGTSAGLVRAVPRPLLPAGVADDARLDALDGGLAFLESATSRGDVLLAAGRTAARVAPGMGAKVVVPGYIVPFVDDVDRRRADAARFFASSSASERRRIIDRYGVSLVLFEATSIDDGRDLGQVVHRDERFVLVAVDRSRSAPTDPRRQAGGSPG